MKTAIDRLRFAVRFAEDNFGRYRDADWAKLRQDLGDFLHGAPGVQTTGSDFGGIFVTAIDPPLVQDYPESKLRELQATTKAILRELADEPDLSGGPVHTTRRPFGLAARWFVIRVAGLTMLSAQGTVRDAFLLRLLFLVNQTPIGNMRRCSECDRLFWRVGRQLYCGSGCSCGGGCANRVSQRAHALRQRERESKKKRKTRERARTEKGGQA